MKKLFGLMFAVALVALTTVVVNAAPPATATATVTVNAAVSATAKLALGASSIHFVDADPDVTSSIPQTEPAITVSAKAKTSTGGNVTLTVVSGSDLTSGTDTIAISNITWTVTGSGFAAGTLNKTTAQSLGSWTNSGTWAGTQTYALANSWAYHTGSYTATLTYTLTAP
jgi:hypothetical protein